MPRALPERCAGRNLRPTLLALAIALAAAAPAIHAQAPAAASQRYDVAAQPLGDALTRIAAAGGEPISIDAELVRGLTAPAVRGEYTVEQAAQQALAGSGLRLARTGNGAWAVQRIAPAAVSGGAPPSYTLREIRVTGKREGETEGTGSYTTEATTVGKTAQALRELPQTVSVLTKQRLEDQNLTDLGSAAAQTVGITVQDVNYRLPSVYSRGFQIESIQLDGGAPMYTGHYANVAYDLAEYDRIEVLRGVAGLLNGSGNPGGAINLVRKMPTAEPQFNAMVSAGSWDNYRSELDASGPLAFDGKIRGRAVLAYENRKYFIDHRASEKPLLYGVIEADIGPRAVLAVGARDQRIHEHGTNTWVPRYSNGADIGLPRHTGLTTDWSYADAFSKEIFAKLTWQVADRWTLRVNATQARQGGDIMAAFGFGAIDPATGSGMTWGGTPQHYWNKQNLIDVNLSGAFDLLGHTHEVLVGVDAQDITSRWLGSTYATNPVGLPVNVFDPAPHAWAMPTANDWTRDYSPNAQRQFGAYGTLRLEVAQGTKLILGARANRFKYEQEYWNRVNASGALDPRSPWSLASATRYDEPTKITPFAGLVHDLSQEWSAYASYAEIYRPQADYKAGPSPGSGLAPMRGNNAELGVKGELLGGKLNTAAALYRVTQDGRAIRDPRYPAENILWAGNCCYLPSGKVTSEGMDLEVNGEAAAGVNLYAGYTYNHNRDKSSNAAFSTITPKHTVKLWGTWQLPGAAASWKLGGGVNFQSTQYVSGTASSLNAATGDYTGPSVPFRYTQASYAVWNAMAEYRIDPRWTLTLNLNNVFDKSYYRTVGSSASGNYYGDPRNVMLTLRARL